MNMVKLFGGGSSRSLVFGFMVATAVLSNVDFQYRNRFDDAARRDRSVREIA